MSVNVVKNDKNHVVVEFTGDAHTFLNLIKKELLNDKSVVFAGYNKPHPLEDYSRLVVKTKKGDAAKAVKNAVSSIQKNLKSLRIK